jgi:hypothetical protein
MFVSGWRLLCDVPLKVKYCGMFVARGGVVGYAHYAIKTACYCDCRYLQVWTGLSSSIIRSKSIDTVCYDSLAIVKTKEAMSCALSFGASAMLVVIVPG